MQPQNYQNHRKLDPLFHYVLAFATLLFFVLSLIHLISALTRGDGAFEAVLLFLASLIFLLIFARLRTYALKAQDRAIVAEEHLRYFITTGKRMDEKLTFKQVVALRFASDAELPDLAHRAATEHLTPNDIKKAIQHWKPDHNRL